MWIYRELWAWLYLGRAQICPGFFFVIVGCDNLLLARLIAEILGHVREKHKELEHF